MTQLKELRRNRGLTQERLAEQAGVSVRTYRNYEAGRRKPSYDTTKALAEALSVPMDKLF